MKQRMTILLLMMILMTACTVNQVSVIQGDQVVVHEIVGEKALRELILVDTPERHFYKLEGNRESIISYEELIDGTILQDGTLSFERVMCECADMTVHTITILDKMIVEKDGQEYIIQDDPKLTIDTYVTKTPERYLYEVGEQILSYDELEPAPNIRVIRPDNSLEIIVKGDHPSHLFIDTSYEEAIRQVTDTPEDYDCFIGEDMCTNQTRGVALLTRNTIHIRRGGIDVSAALHDNTPLSYYVDFEEKEELRFKLVTSEGFVPPPIGWEEFSTLRWNAQTQSTESESLSKKYQLRDLEWIEVVSETIDAQAIIIAELIDKLEIVTVEESRAVRLVDFLAGIESPSAYRYRIIASDGYSPEPFSYNDMEKGYVLLENTETLFPHKNVGKNRIRNAETIELVT